MKVLKYNLVHQINTGTLEQAVWESAKGADVIMPYSDENLEIAKKEAWQGEVVIQDGEQADIPSVPTAEERLSALEAALLTVLEVQNG